MLKQPEQAQAATGFRERVRENTSRDPPTQAAPAPGMQMSGLQSVFFTLRRLKTKSGVHRLCRCPAASRWTPFRPKGTFYSVTRMSPPGVTYYSISGIILICTRRVRGPSNSHKYMPCHLPRTIFPPSIKMTKLFPTNDVFKWLALLPSKCR